MRRVGKGRWENSENYSHDECVDAEGGVSHDVKEASTSCGCAWLGQNNLKENVVKYFENFAVFFAVFAPKVLVNPQKVFYHECW